MEIFGFFLRAFAPLREIIRVLIVASLRQIGKSVRLG